MTAVLAVAVGALLRRSAGAVTAIIVAIVLAYLLALSVLPPGAADPHWQRHLEQVGPMSAGLAIQATVNLRHLPIGPWAGLGVLAAWAVGALLAGWLSLRLRDA